MSSFEERFTLVGSLQQLTSQKTGKPYMRVTFNQAMLEWIEKGSDASFVGYQNPNVASGWNVYASVNTFKKQQQAPVDPTPAEPELPSQPATPDDDIPF